MSYDIEIYAANQLSAAELQSLIAEAGLAVDGDETAATSLVVVRGAKRVYTFTLELPVRIEPEDVPEEITASALAPSQLYQLMVEGSSARAVPHAIAFARRLATAAAGVVLDQQTGMVWSRGKLREPPRVEAGEVSTVEIHWYSRADDDAAVAAAWVELARRHLPEALPRRYGTFEPLQHKLEVGVGDAFADFVGTADGTVFFLGSKPVTNGSIGVNPAYFGPTRSHSLTLFAEPLHDRRWRDAVMRLFLDFAERIDAVFAVAEVVRRVAWSGRSLGYSGTTERSAYLAPLGQWLGLPPYPVWWAWFGPAYAPIGRYLPPNSLAMRGNSLFHRRADLPTDRDGLLPESWLPAELLAVEDRHEPYVVAPLKPAKVIPPELA